jgi:hypothetical protein
MQRDDAIAKAILDLVAAHGPEKSICPSEAARLVDPGPDFHKLMPAVRRVAVRLALEGRIGILRKGKPVDPNEFKGVYRLSAPDDLNKSM